MKRKIVVADSIEDLYSRAAQAIAARAKDAIDRQGRFTIALSGGSTVAGTNLVLAKQKGIDWQKVFIFWGDDRFVPRDHPDSNYRLCRKSLFNYIKVPDKNIMAFPQGAKTPEQAALQYEEELRGFFKLKPGQYPAFDLAFNGMGSDGHTASVFPESPVSNHGRLVVMNQAGYKPWVDRITLTLPVFNHARCVLFTAAGKNKADVLKQVLNGDIRYPAARVRPEKGELVWILDPEIAGTLGF